MNIILRNPEFRFVDYPGLYRGIHSIQELPFPAVYYDTELLIVECDNFLKLSIDISNTRRVSKRCRIVVLAHPEEFNFLGVLFPEIELVDVTTDVSFVGIISGRTTFKAFADSVDLQNREVMFLRYLSFGLNSSEIGERMGMSQRTVKRIKEQLYFKTGLANVSQLTLFGVARSWENLNEMWSSKN